MAGTGVRKAYTHQLQGLRDDVVSLSSMVDKAAWRATEALIRQDVRVAKEVVANDRAINGARWRIEEQGLHLIATQAPMAGDLRSIAAVIHIVTDLERMGDYAAGIAKIVIEIADAPLLKPLIDLPRMSELARSMLTDSITAFIDDDVELARATLRRDDDVDRLYVQVFRELLTYMLEDPATITRATRLLWAAHNYERIADRVTNICEQVVFATTGEMIEGSG